MSVICAISTFSCEQVKPLNLPPSTMLLLGMLSMRYSVPLGAILRSPSTGLVCHSPEMNWETRKRPEASGVDRITKTKQMAVKSQI